MERASKEIEWVEGDEDVEWMAKVGRQIPVLLWGQQAEEFSLIPGRRFRTEWSDPTENDEVLGVHVDTSYGWNDQQFRALPP
eukprot:Skav215719  [mRNA]  locus=scaffold2573:657330:660014:- [translate_table: standard]